MPKLEGPLPVGLPVFDLASNKNYMVMGVGQMKVADDINSDDTVASVIYQDDDGNVFTAREDHFRDRYALLTVERKKAVTQTDGPKLPDNKDKVKDEPISNKQPGAGSSDASTTNEANKPQGTSPPAPQSSKGVVGTKNTGNA